MQYRWDVISSIVHQCGFTQGAEIGVAYGKNLFNILDACPRLHMLAVDMWRPVDNVSDAGPKGLYGYPKMPHELNEAAVRAGAGRFGERLTILKMESTEAAAQVADESLDFVFIDACHAREEAQRDIEAWRPKVREGGMIMGHDIHYPTVHDAVMGALSVYVSLPDNCWAHYA